MFYVKTLMLAGMLVVPTTIAHCQLAWPYPLHSALNPKTPEAVKDYSMTSPLTTDGTYPCKGFINAPPGSPYTDPTVTWAAGSTVNYTIVGTAVHGGGSCQLSMSYDLGRSWNVIFSQVGGCLVDGMTTTVTIPTEAPSGEALLSWSWFNLLGNREMYQNCAVITVTNGGSGLTGPPPFVANAGVNDCHTIEGVSVVFPNPGSHVVYGGPYVNSKPTTPTGFTGSNCVGPEAASLVGSSGSTSSQISSSSSASASSVPAATSTHTSSASSATHSTTSVGPVNANLQAGVTTTSSGAKATCRSSRKRSGHTPHEHVKKRLVSRHRARGPVKAVPLS